jgi:hypothetical protein
MVDLLSEKFIAENLGTVAHIRDGEAYEWNSCVKRRETVAVVPWIALVLST